MNYLHLHTLREIASPLQKKSQFISSGVLTAKEFVEAGDFLVYKCPTWKWCGGDPTKRRSYLPPDKQYLVTKYVPCLESVEEGKEHYPEHHEGEWAVFEEKPEHASMNPIDIDDQGVSSLETQMNQLTLSENGKDDYAQTSTLKEQSNGGDDDNDSTFSMDEYYDAEMDSHEQSGSIVKTRTYDLYITWDKYYKTPRMWLYGYDESFNPLSDTEMFKDVSIEHAHKTVTYEQHPHEHYMCLSIHPCKHADVMKKLVAQRRASSPDGARDIRPDQYLCLFLKFMGTVIPTISYDYSLTM